MKKNILNYINNIEGYKIRVKEIHWSTSKNSTHLLCDEILDTLNDSEDELAECAMGIFNKKIEVGQILPMLPESKELSTMLEELYKETISFKKTIDSIEYSGLVNIIDDLLQQVGKYRYRNTQQ